ncbi:insecticidal delta-endotoxin Cry8Ea1 family protein [Pseudomonas protegens]|uniref:insecticidal delta-endotoxin Cry8Ea1 family protein n=1 Tax=Pseudomonas protegens TaxID=380021 RepID=UPI00274539B4|nr:insecticidal delta-endotoxin Cry8Ea1 family protein [Pseudomonas protegens]MDP9526167.1 insecticidal delta-endotoxin Cry8Ea1 family protein [Pseudomonas protegens]
MQIAFQEIFLDRKKEYVKKKLQAAYQNPLPVGGQLLDLDFDSLSNNVVENLSDVKLPIARADEFYDFTPNQLIEIMERKRSALIILEQKFPLVEGEIIEEDFFSYLIEQFGDLPVNTPVLRRKTNYSSHCYIFSDLQLNSGDLELLPTVSPEDTVETQLNASSEKMAVNIAQSLATGLVSGFGGKIGALMFDSIFPSGVPDYFDQVYEQIKKIVNQEVTANTIDQINGRINGVQAWAKNTYAPRKDVGTTHQKLFDDLTPYVNLLYTEAVQTLMLPRYAKPGFSVFMLAAGAHLALLQEQALVDPDKTNPDESSFAKSVIKNAEDYIKHAGNTFVELVEDRKRSVTLKCEESYECNGNMCITKRFYFWHDDVTGESGERYRGKDAKERALSDLNRYVSLVIIGLTFTLGFPQTIIWNWMRLTKTPIPQSK